MGSTTRAGKDFTTVGSKIGALGTVARTAGMAVTAGLAAAGAAAVAFGVQSVKVATTFDQTMRQVAAVLKVPIARMGDLRGVALDMGNKTSFSARQAGDAMLELAKGGLTQAQIKAGGLQATLTLAAAGGLELGTAANFVIKALGQFGLGVDQAGAAAAALAGGANASTASVEDLGLAMSQVGPGARNAGLSLQETAAVLAAFSDNGIRGSDAGTSLKTMLVNLVPHTKKAKEEMKALGLSFVDAHGAILPITEIAERLKDRLKGLSEAQRISALQTIFGSDSTRAATILMREGATGLAKYIKATKDRGAAEELAKAKTSGAAGAFERLKGTIETVQIEIGTALLPTLTDAADWLSKKIPDALHWLSHELHIARDWWDKNKTSVDLVGRVLSDIFTPAASDAATTTDTAKTAAQGLKETLDGLLETVLRGTQGFIGLARIAGNVTLRVLDLIVATGFAINAIDRLSGGSGHAADDMVAWARDMRTQTRDQLGKLAKDAKDVKEAIDRIHGKHIDIEATASLTGFGALGGTALVAAAHGRAGGGRVDGIGTETSDSNLYRLSKDEHVLSAAEVRGLGGHAAVERMRAAARGGLPGFAEGGAVDGGFGAMERGIGRIQSTVERIVTRASITIVRKAVEALMAGAISGAGLGALAGIRGSNQRIVRTIFASMFGWGSAAQWAATNQLVSHESGWRNTAQNPTSSAYGLFQFLNSTWGGVGIHKTADPRLQAVGGGRYIRGRYHDPIGAWAFWRAHHWYGDGGMIREPVFGWGARSGQRYAFAERGPEYVLPASRAGAGPTIVTNIYIEGVPDRGTVALLKDEMYRVVGDAFRLHSQTLRVGKRA